MRKSCQIVIVLCTISKPTQSRRFFTKSHSNSPSAQLRAGFLIKQTNNNIKRNIHKEIIWENLVKSSLCFAQFPNQPKAAGFLPSLSPTLRRLSWELTAQARRNLYNRLGLFTESNPVANTRRFTNARKNDSSSLIKPS